MRLFVCCTSLSVACGAAVGGSETAQAVGPVQRGGAVQRRGAARQGRQGGGGRGGRGQGAAPVLLEDQKKKRNICDKKN